MCFFVRIGLKNKSQHQRYCTVRSKITDSTVKESKYWVKILGQKFLAID